jgi:hypothetical protein
MALHLTLGIPVLTYGQLLAAALSTLRDDNPEVRAALPISFDREDPAIVASLETDVARFAASLAAPDRLRSTLRLLRAQRITDRLVREPPPDQDESFR